jgi:hypothetical protein
MRERGHGPLSSVRGNPRGGRPLELAGGRAGVRQFGETILPAPVPMIQIPDRPADAPLFSNLASFLPFEYR